MNNIYSSLPTDFAQETVDELLRHDRVRIERIVSKGHTAPADGWYDQDENEWVLVLDGSAVVLFEDGAEIALAKGDHLHIPAHSRHRVTRTDPDRPTIWLAVFY